MNRNITILAILLISTFFEIIPTLSNVHVQNDDNYWENLIQDQREEEIFRKSRTTRDTVEPHQGKITTPVVAGEQTFKVSKVTDLIDYDKDPKKLQQITEFWLANSNTYDCREDNIAIIYEKGVGTEAKVKTNSFLTRKHRQSNVQKKLDVCQLIKRFILITFLA